MTHNKKDKGNVPNLRFPGFTGEWERTELDKISRISKGSGISKDQLSDDGEPCILYGELYTKYKSEIINEVQSRTNTDAKLLIRSEANDVIIPSSGETAVDISTARCVLSGGILLGGDLNIIRLLSGDGWFLSYQLNGVRKYDIAKVAQGVSVVHLYGESLKRLNVFFPSVSEQRKIALFLSLLDQRIETQNKIIEKYESLIKGIKNHILYHPQAQKIALKDILTERNERSVIKNQHKILSSTIKGLFLQSEYFDREIASEDNIGYKVVKMNDIIISPQNLWMGNITFNERFDNGLVSPSYKVFAIRKSFNKYFVAAILKTHRALYSYLCVSEQGASIVRRNLNIELFNELTFHIPSIEQQNKAGDFLKSLDNKYQMEGNFIQQLKKQKAYLLKHMFI